MIYASTTACSNCSLNPGGLGHNFGAHLAQQIRILYQNKRTASFAGSSSSSYSSSISSSFGVLVKLFSKIAKNRLSRIRFVAIKSMMKKATEI